LEGRVALHCPHRKLFRLRHLKVLVLSKMISEYAQYSRY